MARGTGGKDRTAPVVTITSPINSSSISFGTNVTISATATDNKAVSSVLFTITSPTGVLLNSTSDSASPYSISWIAPSVAGNYTITAKATDSSGNISSQSIIVRVYDSAISTTTTTTVPPISAPTLPTFKILATPSVFDQGGEGSCLACAYALSRSVEQYYTTNSISYSTSSNILSPEFIMDNCKVGTGCGSGVTMLYTAEFLKSTGVCTWDILPYDYNNGCDIILCTPSTYTDASSKKITAYTAVSASDIYMVKRLIANNHAVVFSFGMDTNFYNAGGGDCNFVWNSLGDSMYTHGMTIIGYNDSKNAWLVQNSWGSSWACGGKIWMDYNLFASRVGNVYTITTRVDQNYFPIL